MPAIIQPYRFATGGGGGGTPPSGSAQHIGWRLVPTASDGSAYAGEEFGLCIVAAGASVAIGAGGAPFATENFSSTNTTGTYGAYQLFDGSTATIWSSTDKNSQVVGYIFPAAKEIVEVYWTARNDVPSQAPNSAILQCSDDTTTGLDGHWYTVASISFGGSWAAGETRRRNGWPSFYTGGTTGGGGSGTAQEFTLTASDAVDAQGAGEQFMTTAGGVVDDQ